MAMSDLLDLMKWHIDRYDRLRSSTSARASVLLNANTVMATGSLILVNYHIQTAKTSHTLWIECLIGIFSALTLALILRSLWSANEAIAARKTIRALHSGEIPTRFLFNWGDTLQSVDGHSDFARKIDELDLKAILSHAKSELLTDILQHAQRHRHLRSAINTFRFCVVALLGLAAFTFAAALK
ncbi:hypothetical protein [Streptomyces murinus]|uniref:SMODS and SLOG-associating 2TM effector domain-containing protein n=1 Tax=Streptomyces murinus TaxID=33900 RepID=A0A7W3RP23_STRMR|nr:hypothetical protein [Streptomyces murinus]MBA9055993.1 hypothetical protein [Streptomyces murinus]UWW90515.1 hypothetical protein GO605_06320 [Streptomyces murinus]